MQQVFEYSIVQFVPCAQRMERLNVGLLLHCRHQQFVGMRHHFQRALLATVFPEADLDTAYAYLAIFEKICRGEGPGPLAAMDAASRFRWLVAPRNTMLQTTALHTGLTHNAAATLDQLFERLVLPREANR